MKSRLFEWLLLAGGSVLLTIVGKPRTLGGGELLILGGMAVVAPYVGASLRDSKSRKGMKSTAEWAAKYDAELTLTVGKAFRPIAYLIGMIAGANAADRHGLKKQLCEKVVGAAAELCGPDQTRAVFFQLDGPKMSACASWGRGDEPTTIFMKNDARGSYAHKLVDERAYILVKDIKTAPPEIPIRSGTPYKTFLCVAVYGNDRNFGMLSIDAVQPNTLNGNDVEKARALAQLLGAGLAIR